MIKQKQNQQGAATTVARRPLRRAGRGFVLGIATVAIGLMAGHAWARTPVAKLTEFTGAVEISTDGAQWRPVTRAKLLFSGTQVRTGSDGKATLVASANDAALEMQPTTVVKVRDADLQVVSGSASAPKAQSRLSGFFADIQRRWESRQRYTTVRRGVEHPWQVETAGAVTAGVDYPNLVWQNGGNDVSYRLTVGDKVFSVPAAADGAPFVRFTLSGIAVGAHPYRIEVLDAAGAVKYTDKDGGTLTWLADAQSNALHARHQALLADRTKDDDEIAEFLAGKGLLVPAMEHYRAATQANPRDVDVLPALLKLYAGLRLDVLRQEEAATYQRYAVE